MTAALYGQPPGKDPDDAGHLNELRAKLDRWGIFIEYPAEGTADRKSGPVTTGATGGQDG